MVRVEFQHDGLLFVHREAFPLRKREHRNGWEVSGKMQIESGMPTKSRHKDPAGQTPAEKMYLLKLMSQQMLGAKWAYYRKIKNDSENFDFLKEKSLMQQMKATQSALKFTSKNAAKLYEAAYRSSLKDIKAYTGLSEGFPQPTEESETTEPSDRSLENECDAVIVCWTPVKFLLPAKTLRDKGVATQRHTEALIAKLYYKVVGYYADPDNWEKEKLTLYLHGITKKSTYREITKALEPLKADLLLLAKAYQPFKFGKASLSKDVAQDVDSFDDAMSVESFESQVQALYWYEYLYRGMELFLFRYYLTLTTATPSELAIGYLATLFEPVLALAIEIKTLFLGSFETDRSKKVFRVPFIKLKAEKAEEPLRKRLKTRQGIYETYACNLGILERLGMDYSFSEPPKRNSQWWLFVKRYVLGIDRPVQSLRNLKRLKEEVYGNDAARQADRKEDPGEKAEMREKTLTAKKRELNGRLIGIAEERKKIAAIERSIDRGRTLEREKQIEFEKFKEKVTNEEQRLLREVQKLKVEFQNLERLKGEKEGKSRKSDPEEKEKREQIDRIEAEEKELNRIEVRESALMHIMAMLINCVGFQRQARGKILERFEKRVDADRKLEEKRIVEMQRQVEKKLRGMERKLSKIKRLKQEETAKVLERDIKNFKRNVTERYHAIRRDSKLMLQKQESRLKKLVDSIADEKTNGEAAAPRSILQLTEEIQSDGTFRNSFANHVTLSMESQYVETLIPFYRNLFKILSLSIRQKVALIQSLERSKGTDAIPIALSEEERTEFDSMIDSRKEEANWLLPGVLEAKAVCMTQAIPLDTLLHLRIDNRTFAAFLKMKIVAPGSGKPISIPIEVLTKLLELNSAINPVPIHNLLKEQIDERDPQKSVDIGRLVKLTRAG